MNRLSNRSVVLFLMITAAWRLSESRTYSSAKSRPDVDPPGPVTFLNDNGQDAPRGPELSLGRTRHRIGFRRVFIDDDSRPFGDHKSRPVRVSIWYPAVPESEPPMNLDGYVNLHQDPAASDGVPTFREWAGMMKAEESRVESVLALTSTAYRDAPPVSGRFPLIVHASSFRGPAYENYALFEHLAGQGFVVISIPSVGKDATGMTMDKTGVETQFGDLELAYRMALELPYVDRMRVGTMGFSLGAVPAALLAFHDGGIRACASIDGGMCYTYALFGETFGEAEAKLKAAYLQLTQRPAKSMPLDSRFYNTHAVSNAYHFQWKQLDHYDFASMPLILKSARSKDHRPSAQEIELLGGNPTPYDVRARSYQQMVRIIHLFFDAHLRDSIESESALQTLIESKLPEYDEMFSIRTGK